MKLIWLAVVPLLLASGTKSTSHDLDLVKPLTIGGKLQQIIGEIINLPVHFAETAINAFNEFIHSLDDPQDKEVWQETSKDIIVDVGSALSKSVELLPKIPSIVEKAASCIRDGVANIKKSILQIMDVLPLLLKALLKSLLDIMKIVFETLIKGFRLVFTFKKCPSIYCKITSLFDIFKFAQKQISALIETTKISINNFISIIKKALGKMANGIIETMQQLKICFVEDNGNQLQTSQTSLISKGRSISSELEEIKHRLLEILKELFETVLLKINTMKDKLSSEGKEELTTCVEIVKTKFQTLIRGFKNAPKYFENLLMQIIECGRKKWLDILFLIGKYEDLKNCKKDLEKNSIKVAINNKIAEYTDMQKECSKMKYKEICSIGVATNIPAKIKSIIDIIIAGVLEAPSNIKVFVNCFGKKLKAFLDQIFVVLKNVDKCVK